MACTASQTTNKQALHLRCSGEIVSIFVFPFSFLTNFGPKAKAGNPSEGEEEEKQAGKDEFWRTTGMAPILRACSAAIKCSRAIRYSAPAVLQVFFAAIPFHLTDIRCLPPCSGVSPATHRCAACHTRAPNPSWCMSTPAYLCRVCIPCIPGCFHSCIASFV